MQEEYISLEEAAAYEGTSYEAMKKRVQRDPRQYKAKASTRETGGKDQVLVSVTSLTPKARKAWRASRKIEGRELVMDSRKGGAAPWYVTADVNEYITRHEAAYKAATETAEAVRRFIQHDGPEAKSEAAQRTAASLGISEIGRAHV